MSLIFQFTEVSIDSVCLESDGTDIDDDYFQTLPPNEVLVLVTAGNTWQGKQWFAIVIIFTSLTKSNVKYLHSDIIIIWTILQPKGWIKYNLIL